MKLSFKPVRASRAAGFLGPYGGSQLVLTLYRMYFFCFQICNRLPEMMKNGEAGIFPIYCSLKECDVGFQIEHARKNRGRQRHVPARAKSVQYYSNISI